MEEYYINILLENIIEVKNKKTEEALDLSKLCIDKIAHMYSNTKVPVYRFFYKENLIKKNNDYQIKHKCIMCDSIRDVALNNALRKINKNIIRCYTCKELDKFKKQNQCEYMKNTFKNHGKVVQKMSENNNITLLEKLKFDEKIFDNYDDDFKDNYFKRNMTIEEFNYIKPKIISIQNGKYNLNENNDLVYYPIVSISNQTRFCSYLYSVSRNSLEKIHGLLIKCDNCESLFKSKDLHSHKNKIKTLCIECNLTNNIFKIRSYTNFSNEKILYQSKFELKFIRFCNEHKIYIINGPKINYYWNNKIRTYKIDFAIPKLKYLIEIKDNHCWHIDNLNTGKWQSKEEGAQKYIESNENYDKFIMIFPKNYVNLTKKIFEEHSKLII
jgi:hypothetical protein